MGRTISDLRSILFKELEYVQSGGKDHDRSRLVIGLSEQVVDSARVEVQLSAVMKAQHTVPFIEDQSQERSADSDPEGGSAREGAGNVTRIDKLLTSGPAPDHPWRESNGKRGK